MVLKAQSGSQYGISRITLAFYRFSPKYYSSSRLSKRTVSVPLALILANNVAVAVAIVLYGSTRVRDALYL